jgi:copper chaperone CopZ
MIQILEVANVRCSGCANTITKALQESGYQEIAIDLSCEPRKVTVDVIDEAQLAQVKAILRQLGYPIITEESGIFSSTALKAKSFFSCAVGKFSLSSDN